MKVLVSDKMDEAGIDIFENQEGIDVDVNTGLSPEALRNIIGSYDALAIRSATKVDKALLDAAVNLKVVARAGIGLDNVDIDEATRKGVAVMNTPGGNTVTTAEHAIAMMMSLTRNIPRASAFHEGGKMGEKAASGTGDLQQDVRHYRFRQYRFHRGQPGQGAENAGHCV